MRRTLTAMAVAWGVGSAPAQAVRLAERTVPGAQYRVSVRSEATGELTLPPDEPGKLAPPPLKVNGQSVIDYDERYLTADGGTPAGPRTLRVYRDIRFTKTVGGKPHEMTIRPAVRRMVVVWLKGREVPFSPDGPLVWGEIDLVRTDVFAPALAGLLPEASVTPGTTWKASAAAIQELTDLQRIDEGDVTGTFEAVESVNGRRLARLRFAGSVRGVTEDGPGRHTLDGTAYFDPEASAISYVSLTGTHFLLDAQGQPRGKVDGRFVLTRTATSAAELSDAAVRGLATDPTFENTRLLYESEPLKLSFLYPRRWQVREDGKQVFLNEPLGNGLLLTVEPPERVPGVAAYQQETRDALLGRKATLHRADPPQRLREPRPLDSFGYDADLDGLRVRMEYFVVRDTTGGATVAARLLPKDLELVRRDVEALARSVRVGP